ncbi:MAG: hypothetical protein ACUZ8I_02090 [Candidatus Scalindua sp.]
MYEILSCLDKAVWFAVFGAFAIKLLELAELHKIAKLERPDLKDWLYWLPFLIMPLLGGGLAHIYVSSDAILSPLLAVNVGVSAPLILRAMAQINPLQTSTVKTPDDA